MGRKVHARSFLRLAVAGALLAACNNGGGTPDSGPAPDGGNGVDSGGSVTAPVLTPAMVTGGAADLACGGSSTEPTAGALVATTMTLESFGEHGDKAPNTRLCFCPDNVIPAEALAGTGCGSCQDVMSDATGQVSVMARAGGWYAYRVFAHTGTTMGTTFLDSIQVNEPAPAAAGGTVTGNAVSQLIALTISEAQLITRDPTKSTVAGRIMDCDGNDISGAIVRMFRADGSEIIEVDPGAAAGVHYRYFNGDESPDASATATASDGLYVGLNVPPNSMGETIRVEAWAYTGTDAMGESHRIGCETVQLFANGVSIVNIGPERSDYPVGHPCAD